MSCIILGCKSHSSKNSYKKDAEIISFHRFPTDSTMRQKWFNAIARRNWEWKKLHRICSKHFTDDCFVNIHYKWRRLKTNAVPSLDLRNEIYTSTLDYVMTPCDLEVCRICFATDCKLYSMTVYKKLDKAYKMLTGLSIQNEDNLPPYLCTECAQRLINCIRFRAKSLRAHLIMLEVIKKDEDVTLDSIKSVVGKRKIGSALSVTHNEPDHYDLEVEYDLQGNSEDITDDIKAEDENMIADNDGDTTVYLPQMFENTVEHDIKDEVEDQGSCNNEYVIDDVIKDDIVNEIEIKTESIFKAGELYCSTSRGNPVVQDTKVCQLKPEIAESVVNDNKKSLYKIPASYKITTKKKKSKMKYYYGHHIKNKSDNGKVFDYDPGLAEVLLIGNTIRLSNEHMVCGKGSSIGW